MSFYSIALFLHILGAMGLVVALALEWASLVRLRVAETAEQARMWFGLISIQQWLGPASLLAILFPALYMMAMTWGATGWILVAWASLALIAVLWAFNRMRLVSIERAAAAQNNGALADSVRHRLSDPLLLVSVQSRVGVLVGVVFLMVNKPDLAESVVIVGTTFVVGLASTMPVWTRDRARRRLVGGSV